MSGDSGPTVSFGVLGTVELRVAGRPATPLAPAVRALLARLVLAAGRVVSADALADALWGDQPPADATNALQLRVSKLRRALAAAGTGGDLLVTRAPGYQLAVAPDAVDAYRFERLLERARASTGAGPAALACFDEALRLWRGPALADVGEADWALAETARLAELRLGAVEDRLELLLETGRQAEAVADLERLVVAHPLRERLHRLLMLALYRGGRQAEAITAYHALRHRLADELGIDPAPELQALAEAILRQQVPAPAPSALPAAPAAQPVAGAADRGARPETAATAAPIPAPRATGRSDLPRRLASVIGRQDDVQRVLDRLREARVVTLTGPGGVGKTTLALEAVRRVDAALADRLHLVRLSAVPAGADLPEAVADQLGVAAGGPGPAATAALVAWLGDDRALLVVDNCEHVIDEVAELVEQLVAACPAVTVLTTSREALAVPGETQLAVAPLGVPDGPADLARLGDSPAVALFVDRARAVRPGFVLDEATAPVIADICRQLDGMPLAIELAAARVKALPPAEIAARLHDRFALLTAGARTSEARHRTLRATLDWSHDLLTEAERRLLRRLAVFRGGWDLTAAERVCAFGGLAADKVLDLLFRLVDRSLVVPDPTTGRFRLLVTIREYAAARLAEAGETAAARDRHLTHFTELAERYGPHARTDADAWARPTEEHDNFRAAVDRCLERTDGVDAGLRLADALFLFWNYGPRYEGIRALTALLATGQAAPAARAAALQRIGQLGVYYPTAQTRAAARESLVEFVRLGDRVNTAVSRLVVAWEGQYDGDPDRYRAMVAQARRERGDTDDPWWHGTVCYIEALLDLRTGAFARSAEQWRRSLDLTRRAGDRLLPAGILAHLGIALREAGRQDEAIAVLEEAAAETRRNPSPHALAFTLVQLAHTRLDRGEVDGVPAMLAEAAETARRSGNPRCQAWAAWGRARIAYAGGDATTAADECRRAVQLLEEREFPWARLRLWSLTAEAAADAGRQQEADAARRAAAALAPATR
ncbi:winged helix-turn-helix domain-containing protein [Micromonospora sp. DR5-3]|uniref:AfsR/SARP family transcriptional regulator n=1 Tax=unclassified Micromonospora TaxID=2617518 RepID=UPI0011D4E0C6|nr:MULTISPECIES: BTAD domain-containing putative transcriptional regulator [unclassified Micromonospora]MCW3816627.1 winged helix-turn-helix domain-containing protein [Micromonospora sp. DR5-3]TYC23029.1 AfsR/SARP family transcriptional regulator [Micromonospora sp. MP36]